ncbi:MAG: hypothetical protein KDD62_09960 [Bdellovibrionales bacterium]|nr:hypothetical protein [Bdellovibrionales bacterium]
MEINNAEAASRSLCFVRGPTMIPSQNLTSLLGKYFSSNQTKPSFQSRPTPNPNNFGQQVSAERKARNEARKAERTGSDVPTTPAPPDAPVTAQPVDQKPIEATSLDELAKLYVDQYEEKAGVTLSAEERNQKISEVRDFYGKQADGQERLDKIVFSNDEIAVA